MGKKSGGDGGAGALAAAQEKAINALEKGKQEGYGFLDQSQRQGLENINPLIPQATQIMQGAMSNVANIDNLANAENQRVQQLYLNPAQKQIRSTLDNLYARAGVGGNNNSRFQNMMLRNSDELLNNEALRQYNLEKQTRNDLMDRYTQQYNFGATPVMYKSNVDMETGKAKANTAIGSATQMSNTYGQFGQAQAQAQANAQAQKSNSKGGLGQMFGAGLGAVGSMLGGKK